MSSWSCCAPSGRRVTSSGDGARRRCPAPSSLPTISASGSRWEPSVWAALNRGSKDRRSRVSNGRPTARAVASRLADSAMSFCAPENACCASWLVPICCASPLRLSCRIVGNSVPILARTALSWPIVPRWRSSSARVRPPGLRRLGVRQRHRDARRQPRVRLEAERRELLGHRPLRDLVLPLLLALRRELGEVHERLASLRPVEPRPARREGLPAPPRLRALAPPLLLARRRERGEVHDRRASLRPVEPRPERREGQ